MSRAKYAKKKWWKEKEEYLAQRRKVRKEENTIDPSEISSRVILKTDVLSLPFSYLSCGSARDIPVFSSTSIHSEQSIYRRIGPLPLRLHLRSPRSTRKLVAVY